MSDAGRAGTPPIAVIGVGTLFPGSGSERDFWRDILAGRDLVGDVPPDRWRVEDYYDPDPAAPDKTYSRRGAFLGKVDFAPLDFGIPPNAVPATDTAQLLALIVAQRALLDAAQGDLARLDRERCSVILGVTSAQELMIQMAARLQRPIWLKALRETGIPEEEAREACDRMAASYVPWQEATFPGLLGNVVAGRIANRFDLHGTNCVADAACASSLAAVGLAIDELTLGRANLALAGGVDTYNDISMYLCFSKTPALSPSQDCRPFDEAADGTVLGEGLGMVVLKRLADAERDGDRIYAVIRGVGSSSDGRALSIYAPLPEGQARALRRAYAEAGYGPESVELVEAHGTGTKAGDAAEFAALSQVFGESGRADRQWCGLGSVKSQLGHAKAAAGAAGLFKVVMALHHKVLPPTIKVAQPSSKLGIAESPFYLNTAARPWIRAAAAPRRASLSSFGFGGSNFHVTLEEYTGRASRAPRLRTLPGELLLFSADSAEALVGCCRAAAEDGASLAAAARRTQAAFEAGRPARLAVVAKDRDELREALRQAAEAVGREPARPLTTARFSYEAGGDAGGIAFLFPGQGSQYAGMGADLAMSFDAARAAWDAAAALAFDGVRLQDVVFPRPAFDDAQRARDEARLTSTEWAQPALGAASAALLGLLRLAGVEPELLMGHSFGELSALWAAGVLGFEDLLRTARRRGELMAEAAATRPGAMTAVSAGASELAGLLAGLSVVVANHNAPRQAVLSGPTEELEALERRLAESGLSHRRLPVATAFHSPVVAAAAEPFREFLEAVPFRAGSRAVYSNAEAAPYPSDPGEARRLLASQLTRPVRFSESIEALYARGIRTFVEVGPGAVLSGLVDQCLADRPHRAIALDGKGRHGVLALWHGLGRLAVAGVRLDLEPFWQGFAAEDAAAARKEGFTLPIDGGNYGRPYPPAPGTELPPPNPPRAAEPPRVPEPQPAAGLEAFDAYQRALSEGHQKYLATVESALADGHKHYLQAMESSFAAFSGALAGRQVAAAAVPAWTAPKLEPERPRPVEPVAASVAPAALAVPAAAAPALAAPPTDRSALLLDVVSEKTGYPKQLLDLDMALEADLGIDSIKRVEILAALQERLPGSGRIEAAEVAQLGTLRQVVARLTRDQPPEAAQPVPAAPAAPTAPAATSGPLRLVRHVVRAVPCDARGESLLPRMARGRVVITPDGGGVAEALVARLAERGVAAEIAQAVPAAADCVVFLGGLRAVPEGAAAIAVSREAFAAARSVAARLAREGGAFVTVQDTGGDFGTGGTAPERAWLGALAGLAKTAALEWPAADVRAIDVECGDAGAASVADALLAELDLGGGAREIGLTRDGRRWTLQPTPSPAAAGELPVSPDSVLVVSGGGRGATAAAILALARAARPRFLILGRSPLEPEPPAFRGLTGAALQQALLEQEQAAGRTPAPAELKRAAERVAAAREVSATLHELQALGSRALYVALDVRDEAAVRGALGRARQQLGPITGIVHGAGVLSDRLIAEKSPDAFARVLETKLLGLRHLLAASEPDPLRVLVLFSSVAAREGNAGQSDYAMANEALNKVAAAEARRRGPACLVRSLNWGPLDGGMVDASLRQHFAARGVPLLPLAQAGAAFVEELRGSQDGVEVVLAAGDAEPAPVPLEFLTVGAREYPWLADHAIDGVPVIPAVLVLDWFCRAAQQQRPELELFGCEELRVLKGIPLRGFGNGGEPLVVHGRRLDAAADWSMELRDPAGTLHYTARVRLAARPEGDGAGPSPAALAPSPWSADELYRGPLFHGPALRAIRSIEGISADGIVGTLCGTVELGLAGGPFRLDVAALDGALQLARAWGAHRTGRLSLPTRIGAVRLYGSDPFQGPWRCVLEGRVVGEHRTLSNLRLSAPDGRPYADLTDVEMHLHADRRSA